MSNIPDSIKLKIGKNLHKKENHPIYIIKNIIYNYFRNKNNGYNFEFFEDFDPYVSITDNFDLLRIPLDHPSRRKSDTYYLNENTVLRTHTSAHQNELLKKGHTCFLVSGDVYRKDEVNATHYPVFHQLEGVCIVQENVNPKDELLKTLSGLVEHLFPNCEYRVAADYFPFTDPSFEIEVKYNDKWLEILGCGVIHKEILDHNNIKKSGYAFGLGLERLAMILFDIPDIRYFWTDNRKFLDQFSNNNISKFVPYSNLDSVTKDISFWINSNEIEESDSKFVWTNTNDFYELVRNMSDDSIENVELFDTFKNNKKMTYSHSFRITIRPCSHTENNLSALTIYANDFMNNLRNVVATKLNVQLR